MMVRESVWDGTAKATRAGTFALISPVITSTEGRWVARIRWMPAARDFWARRAMRPSTSLPAVYMRSASSSTTTTMFGYRSFGSTFSL